MLKKPNILVFMTDQQNAATVCAGSDAITPNIDAFRERSLEFLDAYCPAPHCCPSRATFFSGLYPSQHGVWNNVEVDNALSRGLYDDVTLFPQVLQAQGYHTVFAGKWHVSACEGPADRGFDTVLHEYISNYGRFPPANRQQYNDWKYLYSSPEKLDLTGEKKTFGQLAREGYPLHAQFGISENPYGDTTIVDAACRALRAHRPGDAPLFLFVGPTGPHDPYCPPQEYLDLYKDAVLTLPESFADDMEDKPALYRRTRERFDLTREEHLECYRRYLAFVSYEDALFGRLLTALQESGEQDSTYVLYLTDHGDYMGAHRLWTKGLPCFQEAYHICAMLGGGDISAHRQIRSLVSLADFAPTILSLAGISPLPPMQGRPLTDFMAGSAPDGWRTEMFTQTNGNELYGIQRAVWNKKWKYVLNGFDYDELYDLENDPHEMHNLIRSPALKPVVKELCQKLWLFARETHDNCTCDYVMVSLAPYGPGIVLEENAERQVQQTAAETPKG